MPKKLIELLRQHRFFLIPFIVFIIIGFCIQISMSKSDLFMIINVHHNGFFDYFFRATTLLGDGVTIVFISFILLFIKFRYSIVTILAYAYTSVFAQIIKHIFNSPRPSKFFESLNPIRTIEGYPVHSWNSFPSGHSVSAFTLAMIIAYLLPLKYKNRAWLILPFALLTAFSRVYLAQHFLQDVVAGAILGVFLTFQLIWWLENSKWYHSPKLNGKLFCKAIRINTKVSVMLKRMEKSIF